MVERDVVRLLGEWERVVGEGRGRMMMTIPQHQQQQQQHGQQQQQQQPTPTPPTPPHLLPPHELYLAHLRPWLEDVSAGVSGEMVDLRRENEALVSGIGAQRGEVEALVKGLEGVVGDLEGANQVMGNVVGEGGEVRREAVDVDVEMMDKGRDGDGMGGIARSRL